MKLKHVLSAVAVTACCNIAYSADGFEGLPRPGGAPAVVTSIPKGPGAPAIGNAPSIVTKGTPTTGAPSAVVGTTPPVTQPAVVVERNNPFKPRGISGAPAPVAPAPAFNGAPGFGGFQPRPAAAPTGFNPPTSAGESADENPIKRDGKLIGVVNGKAVYKADSYYFDKPGVAPKITVSASEPTDNVPQAPALRKLKSK